MTMGHSVMLFGYLPLIIGGVAFLIWFEGGNKNVKEQYRKNKR